jgi:hypothetical protein
VCGSGRFFSPVYNVTKIKISKKITTNPKLIAVFFTKKTTDSDEDPGSRLIYCICKKKPSPKGTLHVRNFLYDAKGL